MMLFDNFRPKFSLANRSALFVCLCLGEGKNGGGAFSSSTKTISSQYHKKVQDNGNTVLKIL